MATFSDDFSTRSGTANYGAPTGIGGWTLQSPSGGAAYIAANIVEEVGTLGGKILRITDSGYGAGLLLMHPDAIGSVAAATATEVLTSFRIGSIASNNTGYGRACVAMLRTLLDGTRSYGVGFRHNSDVDNVRGWHWQSGTDWDPIGALKDITADFAVTDWWWCRIQVTAGGVWQWRVWEDGTSEPGTWDASGVTQTTNTLGYVGVGSVGGLPPRDPLDFQWFSVGTGADAAPMPGGASIPIAAIASMNRRGAEWF